MRTVELHQTDLDLLEGLEAYCVYNGLDVLVDNEIATEHLYEKVQSDPHAKLIYDFETACLAPAFAMMKRGVLVDMNERATVISELEAEEAHCEEVLNKLARAVCDLPLNPRSPKQLKHFFYNEMCLDPIHVIIKGEKKESTNIEALEKLQDREWIASPFVDLIFAARKKRKLISILRSEVDTDGRMRFSFNVGATETGRWSSSANPFGSGTNAQNITQRIRRVFIADEGKILVYRDLSSAESRWVGARCLVQFGLDNYLRACDHPAGLHTVTARNVWRAADWPADQSEWRAFAERPHYRGFSKYDLAKRGGHATNYYTTPPTMAKHLRIPLDLAQSFQHDYKNSAFPEIPLWHQWNIENVQVDGFAITALGRKRTFLGRKDDPATWREAIANEPQSGVGDTLNLGLWRVWRWLEQEPRRLAPEHPRVELLAQVHDAILYQVDVKDLEWSLRETEKLMAVATPFEGPHGKLDLVIPSDAEIGYNWEKQTRDNTERNPDGMRKWKGQGAPQRAFPANPDLLDRMSGLNDRRPRRWLNG